MPKRTTTTNNYNNNWSGIDFLGLLIFKHKAKTNFPSFGIERRPLSGQNFLPRLSSRLDKSNVLNEAKNERERERKRERALRLVRNR